jgi:hypothetical protein
LFGLAVLFYLYDSSVLLYSNQAVLTGDTDRHWSARTGFRGFLLAGRTLCVLNPFTPHRPSFRLSWDFNALEPNAVQPQWAERIGELKMLAPLSLTAGIGLFVLLPLGMFTSLGAYAVIPALVLLYGSIVLSLIQVRRRRILIPSDRKRFLSLAFECLACPPFGINLVRRTTLAERITEPLPLAASRLLDASGWSKLRALCLSQLEDAKQSAVNSEEEKRLEAQRQRLLELDCRP